MSTPTERLLSRLDARSYAERLGQGRGLVLLPAGATEQHGPHMPLGVDALLAEGIALRVAEEIDALVAPSFVYGYRSQPRSGGGDHRTGTISVDGAALSQMTYDVASSLIADGVNRLVVINGHYENHQFLYDGLGRAISNQQGSARAILASYWDFVDVETLERVYPDGFPGWDIEHGGVLETCLMMLLYPQLVDESKFPNHGPAERQSYDIFPEDPRRTPESGCLSAPIGASVEKGQALMDAICRGLSEAIHSEFSGGAR